MDMTLDNFNDDFEEIRHNLKKSCFVGFDAEFTAILTKDCFTHRLFDTNEERYDMLKNDVSAMLMTQVGLTMFQYDRDRNAYNGMVYTFHLRPQQLADIDQSFIFQASTLKFLCKHKFNFNKFIYEGIPYLNKREEEHMRKMFTDSVLFKNLERNLSLLEEKELQDHCSEVSRWLSQSKDDTKYIDTKDPTMRFLVHTELRKRFPDILTTDSLGDSNMILVYRNKYIEGASSAPTSDLQEKLMKHVLGFSRIIDLLAQYKKPIIGHNLFMDLILLHNQFIGPLPQKYSEFKKNINEVLPTVYDTKYISHDMRKKLSFHDCWRSNALSDLYEFFRDRKLKINFNALVDIQPVIPFNQNQSYHEAGWDSFVTGYCFIMLGHWVAHNNSGTARSVTPTENLAALSPYCNLINVIRGAVPYMNLTDADPPSHRPKIVKIRVLNEKNINIDKVAEMLSNFGTIDVKPFGTKTALVAASTQFTADNILKKLRHSREYKVSVHNSLPKQLGLWSGAVITGGVVLFYIHRKIKQ